MSARPVVRPGVSRRAAKNSRGRLRGAGPPPRVVRIEASAYKALTAIAEASNVTLTEAVSRAVESFRRKMFLDGLLADYAALRANGKASAEELADLPRWDKTKRGPKDE